MSLSLSTVSLGLIAMVIFIVVSTFIIGKLLDKKIGDIRVNMPRMKVEPNVVIRMTPGVDPSPTARMASINGAELFTVETSTKQNPSKPSEDIPANHANAIKTYEPFLNVKFDASKPGSGTKEASIEDDLGCKPIVVNTTTPPTTAKILVGCTKDSDCNIVNGGGKNVCKSDGTCSCIGGGSGQFCHYGPTNFRDPKDMTDVERRRFKAKYRGNMTLQDYKNWLELYREDPEDLREAHRRNLQILMQGGNLSLKDVPALTVQAPTDAADYFQQMYKDGNVAVVFPENEGPYVGANYGQFDSFEPPEYVSNAITGVVNAYTMANTKDDAFATDWYTRPLATVGVEEQRAGDIYLKYIKQQQNLADFREVQRRTCGNPPCQSLPVALNVFSGETNLQTFLSGDMNADLYP